MGKIVGSTKQLFSKGDVLSVIALLPFLILLKFSNWTSQAKIIWPFTLKHS